MPLSSHRAVLSVDLSALVRNAEALKRMAGGARLGASVKANAYGIGARAASQALATGAEIDTFFVAFASEAVEILTNAPALSDATVFVLNGPFPEDQKIYDDPRILPVLNSLHQAATWRDMGGRRCALMIDVGMNRLGTSLSGAQAIIDILPPHSVVHVLMHLSHSSDPHAPQNHTQIELFQSFRHQLSTALPNAQFSLAASGGLFLNEEIGQSMARPGAALYGLSPTSTAQDALESVATLTAPVLMVRQIAEGQSVGYSGRWTAPAPSVLAILGLGYADGYPRALANKGQVFLADQRCPVVGAVSMDLIAVDITAIQSAVEPGDRAEIYGPTMLIDEQAAAIGTIGYELLSTIGSRVLRLYTD